MDIEHPCGMLNCNHNMDFSCCDHREFLGCEYKTYANFYDKHIGEVEIHPYVIDEEEGETIIYAESPEEALRRFFTSMDIQIEKNRKIFLQSFARN